MKRGVGIALFVGTVMTLASGTAGQEANRKKKIIEWGWDSPTTAFVRENIDNMEMMPFDGLVFDLKLSDGTNFTWKMWGATRYEYSGFKQMVEDLTQTAFKSFTDRFLRVNATPGNVDWLDDQAWSVVVDNFSAAAKVAKAGNCKGFMFDVEQYQDKPFSLAFSINVHKATREEYRAKVRQRGRELITAVSQEFPDIVILMPWAYLASSNQDYSLLPDFLDGILEAAPPTIMLVDAGEGAYYFKSLGEFEKLYKVIKEDTARLSALPEMYREKVEAGFGIWIDADSNKKGWHQDDSTRNYFNPNEFKSSVGGALQTSDEYVWIYSQSANWWRGKNIPGAYIDAIKEAKDHK
ncbi:hypothetical protein QEV83_08120 [Methylocapsa sp. D3K7]|uniref:hypothetical protein n=1 Tax=Methylocapsa sp. D3K7 TaxID=3041435 RepID=UPI00244ECF6A|nr:hypothetical protein [Methylocapsa sp. D3K7]WGJ16195.1 hypothetical protein QEV83_08120 [Methylocapsa sp. D3K7]